jgi:hypothetical protein
MATSTMKTLSVSLVLVGLVTSFIPSAQAQNSYSLDDGASNTFLSPGLPADMAWMQSYTTVGASDTITKLRLSFQPGAITPGTALHLCVWEDPNNDFNPTDVQLIAQLDTTMPVVGSLNFIDFPLVTGASVSGVFFVGAFTTVSGNGAPLALIDTDALVTARAWFANAAAGTFNPALMASNIPSPIETLGANFHGAFMLRAEGSGSGPTIYCTPKVNSLGCSSDIAWMGTPSVSSGSGFFLQAGNVVNRKVGMLLYSVNGRATTPFGGGTICIAPRLQRTPLQNSGGALVGNSCTGSFSLDFAQWIATGGDIKLIAGTTITAQYYSRDPGFVSPGNVGLSSAIEFLLAP